MYNNNSHLKLEVIKKDNTLWLYNYYSQSTVDYKTYYKNITTVVKFHNIIKHIHIHAMYQICEYI